MTTTADCAATTAPPAVLIAGVGNIFAGDDAFGVEVAQRLRARQLPANMRVVDFGNRAIDLAYALQDQCDAAVLIDATTRGGPPGTLYVIDPEIEPGPAAAGTSGIALGHDVDPNAVLRMIGGGCSRCRRIVIVGCEPQTLGDEFDGAIGLSMPVAAAVEQAIGVVERVAAQLSGART